ncbi:hypothetical protein J6590_048925 [Homalodisca vitripennis]|nr:hypothetical protein J6590_048925 [Homalodisca vitripennis]
MIYCVLSAGCRLYVQIINITAYNVEVRLVGRGKGPCRGVLAHRPVPHLTLPGGRTMSTMEEVNLELDKLALRQEDMPSKEKPSKNFLLEAKTRSTPTSPNCFRTQAGGNSKPRLRESPIIRLALFPRLEKCISEPEVWNDKGGGEEKEVPVENTCSGSRSEGHISNMSGEKRQEDQTHVEVSGVHSRLFPGLLRQTQRFRVRYSMRT